MKKAVNKKVVVNGQKQSVLFREIIQTSTYQEVRTDKLTHSAEVEPVEWTYQCDFLIDGKTYQVIRRTKLNTSRNSWYNGLRSVSYECDGKSFGDSQKKVIEHILATASYVGAAA